MLSVRRHTASRGDGNRLYIINKDATCKKTISSNISLQKGPKRLLLGSIIAWKK